MKIQIFNLVGENCVTREDGQKIYELIHPELVLKKQVELDFDGVNIFASLFFNAAIGQLLKDISAENLNAFLKLTNLQTLGVDVLKRVIVNAKKYYSDPKFRDASDAILKGQSEEE